MQLLAAEMLISRIPGGRSKAGRRAALASAVWMLDPKRRTATRTAGRMAGSGPGCGSRGAPSDGSLSRPEALLPAALGATERKLDQLRLRLRQQGVSLQPASTPQQRAGRVLGRLAELFEIGRQAGTNRPGLGGGEQRAHDLVAVLDGRGRPRGGV